MPFFLIACRGDVLPAIALLGIRLEPAVDLRHHGDVAVAQLPGDELERAPARAIRTAQRSVCLAGAMIPSTRMICRVVLKVPATCPILPDQGRYAVPGAPGLDRRIRATRAGNPRTTRGISTPELEVLLG